MRLNSTGSAAYGRATVAIDGAIPAALSGFVAGGPNGPNWFTDSRVLFAHTNVMPALLQTYDTGSTAIATVASGGATAFAGGGGVWARFLSASGVTTSVGGLGPFASAGVGDVSADGHVALIDHYATFTGLTVYDSTGATVLARPSVVLVNRQNIRLRDGYLAYQDGSGWHLVNIATGKAPMWFPRIDGVTGVVPVIVDGTLYVVESQDNGLSVRPASLSTGYQIEANPDAFNPDAMAFSAGVLRAGFCTTQAEGVSTVVLVDVTLATGANMRGTVVAGSIVFTAQPNFTPITFAVGAAEGQNLTNAGYQPVPHQVVDPKTGMASRPYEAFWRQQNQNVSTVSQTVQKTPVPPAPVASFGVISSPGQPDVPATSPGQELTVQSPDGSVQIQTDPANETVNLLVRSGLVPSMMGDDGPEGDMGPPGVPGPSGSSGAAGAAGVPGQPGDDGAPGQDAFPGQIGPQGNTGATGPQGIPGPGIVQDEGPQGEMGFPIPGPVGPAGPSASLINIQTITATGSYTYTPTGGTTRVVIELQGAGAGGSGVASAGVNQVNLGGGGGGGEWIQIFLTANFSGATGSVGTGGTGGTAGDNNGNDGGNTTFITTAGTPVTYTAHGGSKGVPRTSFAPPITNTGGSGGTGGNGNISNMNGGDGFSGIAPNQFVGYASGGGSSRYSSYTPAATVANGASSAGSNGNGFGGGGSGAVSSNAGGAKAGGTGSNGKVIIYEYA